MGQGCGMFGSHSGCNLFGGGGCNNCSSGCDYGLPTYDGNYGAPINYGTQMIGQPGCNCGNGQPTINGPTYVPGAVMNATPYQGQVIQAQPYQGQMIGSDSYVQDGGWGATINAASQAPPAPYPMVPQQIQGQSYQVSPPNTAPHL